MTKIDQPSLIPEQYALACFPVFCEEGAFSLRIDGAKETGGQTSSRLQLGSFPQEVSFWNDCAELPRQRGHIFARGCRQRSFLRPERQ
jgi:hypothetical protein